jgi:hypothetical protein
MSSPLQQGTVPAASLLPPACQCVRAGARCTDDHNDQEDGKDKAQRYDERKNSDQIKCREAENRIHIVQCGNHGFSFFYCRRRCCMGRCLSATSLYGFEKLFVGLVIPATFFAPRISSLRNSHISNKRFTGCILDLSPIGPKPASGMLTFESATCEGARLGADRRRIRASDFSWQARSQTTV